MSARMTQSGFITQGKISKPGLEGSKFPTFFLFFSCSSRWGERMELFSLQKGWGWEPTEILVHAWLTDYGKNTTSLVKLLERIIPRRSPLEDVKKKIPFKLKGKMLFSTTFFCLFLPVFFPTVFSFFSCFLLIWTLQSCQLFFYYIFFFHNASKICCFSAMQSTWNTGIKEYQLNSGGEERGI